MDWVVDAVVNRGVRRVVVFCVWIPTQTVLGKVLSERLKNLASVCCPKGARIDKATERQFRCPNARPDPMVLVLTDKFSESIDLDVLQGDPPAVVHHDLPWNPARMRQRWGRVVRIPSGNKKFREVFVPVMPVEVDERLATVLAARSHRLAMMVPPATDEDEVPWARLLDDDDDGFQRD